MNRLDARLTDVLEPVRDVAVGDMLEAMARGLERGYDVRPEPKQRDKTGHVTREGQLFLPRRGDLQLLQNGHNMTEEMRAATLLSFEPITLVEPDGFVCIITPFRWNEACILVERGSTDPDWGPVRRWYLEWFQARFSDEAPDLEGAVHRLRGPEEVGENWMFQIDLGSAPVETLSDMIAAFAVTGAQRIRICAECRVA